jgi:dienelactone hydrolase
MTRLLIALLALALPAVAFAEFQSGPVEYKDRDTVLEGYLALPKGAETARPGVLVVPDWMGLKDFDRQVADKLAEMGYVAFAVDMYGKGVRPADGGQAAALATKYKSDRGLMRERMSAALETLRKVKTVDEKHIAAIGYCFGGTAALELARSGAPVAGVVSFHGGLETPTPQDAKNIKGKILALHGADDPFVPPKEVAAFQEEMRTGKVDWQMNFYGDAVHSFTNPAAGTDNSKGAAYNEKAAKRSWEAMKIFFKEIL